MFIVSKDNLLKTKRRLNVDTIQSILKQPDTVLVDYTQMVVQEIHSMTQQTTITQNIIKRGINTQDIIVHSQIKRMSQVLNELKSLKLSHREVVYTSLKVPKIIEFYPIPIDKELSGSTLEPKIKLIHNPRSTSLNYLQRYYKVVQIKDINLEPVINQVPKKDFIFALSLIVEKNPGLVLLDSTIEFLVNIIQEDGRFDSIDSRSTEVDLKTRLGTVSRGSGIRMESVDSKSIDIESTPRGSFNKHQTRKYHTIAFDPPETKYDSDDTEIDTHSEQEFELVSSKNFSVQESIVHKMIIDETIQDAIQFIHKASQIPKTNRKFSSIALEILETQPKSKMYIFIDILNQVFNQTSDFLLLGDLLELFLGFDKCYFLMLEVEVRLYELYHQGYFSSKIKHYIVKSIDCVKKMIIENENDEIEGFFDVLEKSTEISKSVWEKHRLKFSWFDSFIGKKVFKDDIFHKIMNAEVEKSEFKFPLLKVYQRVIVVLLKLIYEVDEIGDMIDLYSVELNLERSRDLQISPKPISIILIFSKVVAFLITQIFKVWAITKASNNSPKDIKSVTDTILTLFHRIFKTDPTITYEKLLKSDLTEPKIARTKYLSLKSKRLNTGSHNMYQKIYQTVKDRVHTDKLSFLKSGVYLTVEQVYCYMFIRYNEAKNVFNIGYTNTKNEPVLVSVSDVLFFTEFKSERKGKEDYGYGDEWMRIYRMEESMEFKVWIKLGTTKGDIVGYFRSLLELQEFKTGILNLLAENQAFIKKKIKEVSVFRLKLSLL